VRIATIDDLGAFVRERRNDLGLTQTGLAARAKVSRRWLSDLENGKENAQFGLVLRTLSAIGVLIDLRPAEQTTRFDLDDFLERRKAQQ
jgi:HTH-type transcriptional regulator/antitoxin HipB